jgi:hypothetical protein
MLQVYRPARGHALREFGKPASDHKPCSHGREYDISRTYRSLRANRVLLLMSGDVTSAAERLMLYSQPKSCRIR